MNIVKIGDMVKNDGYKIYDFEASACERYDFSENYSMCSRHYAEKYEDSDYGTSIVRTISIRLFRNNEHVKFSEKYDTDQKFGKDAAELSKLIAEVGTTIDYSNKRRLI